MMCIHVQEQLLLWCMLQTLVVIYTDVCIHCLLCIAAHTIATVCGGSTSTMQLLYIIIHSDYNLWDVLQIFHWKQYAKPCDMQHQTSVTMRPIRVKLLHVGLQSISVFGWLVVTQQGRIHSLLQGIAIMCLSGSLNLQYRLLETLTVQSR